MDTNPFNCPQRDRLFKSMKFNWYNFCPIDGETGLPISDEQMPYALYHCHQVSGQTIQEIKQASELVGRVFMDVWPVIRALDEEALLYYGFPQETIKLIKYDPLAPFCMRLDWCWNQESGVKKVVETNPQTPSFWVECTEGNRKVAQHFGLKDPDVNSQTVLKLTLDRHIQRAAVLLNKPIEQCRVGFTTLNNPEDSGTMQWLSRHFQGKSVVFPLEYLRIKDGEYLFYERTGEVIDILFMWYPIEWAIHDQDETGKKLWPALEQLILEKKVVVVNFGSAFSLQPKSIFALISDLGVEFFGEKEAATVFDYFPKTSMTAEAIGTSYFAKPILGRQGEGGFAVHSGDIYARSNNNDPWYTKQNYVYQELLEFPKVSLEGDPMTVVWGAWLYNDGRDRFVSGGLGIRLSEGQITDDYSYWCPIGC
jgi:glutathionylspermidine synthase